MNYLYFLILNTFLIVIFLSGKQGLLIGFIIFLLYFIFYLFFIRRKIKKRSILNESHNFIKYLVIGLYSLNKEEYLNLNYLTISNKSKKIISSYKNDNDKLFKLNEYYRYPPFTIFNKIFNLSIKKHEKIYILESVLKYSNFYLNIDNNIENIKNLKDILNKVLLSNLVFSLTKYLFFINIDASFYFTFFIIFIIQFIFICNGYKVFFKEEKSIYNYFIECLINCFYMTPFNCFESLCNSLDKKNIEGFKLVLKSYEDKDINPTLSLINKNKEDILMCDFLLLMFRLSINNGVSESDKKYLFNLIEKLCNQKKVINYKISNIYLVFLIGILYFIYNILVNYGTF